MGGCPVGVLLNGGTGTSLNISHGADTCNVVNPSSSMCVSYDLTAGFRNRL